MKARLLHPAMQFVLILVLFGSAVGLSSTPAQADRIDMDTRTQLQFALREHISENSPDGAYRYFDPETGEVRLFRLKHVHSQMFRKDGFYLLCADFIDKDNNEVILDYVLHETSDGFRIDQILKGRRSFLMGVFERIL